MFLYFNDTARFPISFQKCIFAEYLTDQWNQTLS